MPEQRPVNASAQSCFLPCRNGYTTQDAAPLIRHTAATREAVMLNIHSPSMRSSKKLDAGT